MILTKPTIPCVLLLALATIVSGQQNPNIFIYNDGQDTISLPPIKKVYTEINDDPIDQELTPDSLLNKSFSLFPNSSNEVIIMDSVQIDGLGAKEVIICRKFSLVQSVHGGTFDGMESRTIEQIEIWNLDTKERYWEEVVFYDHEFIAPYNRPGRLVFKYNFSIDNEGVIAITKDLAVAVHNDFGLKEEFVIQGIDTELQPRKYYFENGKYITRQ